jgi:ParB family chromosome partitioning protein
MPKKRRFGVSEALSRGLSETIHVVENNAGIFRNVVLPLSRIELDPDNPRKLAIGLPDILHGLTKSDPLYGRKAEELERLKELAVTINSSGVINPIVVYKLGEVYRVVAGERRCLASILAGKQEIAARVFNEKPQGFELKLIQWIENTAREDLTLDERVNNIRDIIHEYQQQQGEVSITPTLLKSITGLSLSQAAYYGAVLNAPEDVRQMIENGKIRSLDKAAIITGITSPEVRQTALYACVNGCSLKELRRIITREKQNLKKHSLPKVTAKRGRALSRINMGSTFNAQVIHTLIESVLIRAEYKKYAAGFLKVDWAHLDQATQAFKKLIEILEHQSGISQ